MKRTKSTSLYVILLILLWSCGGSGEDTPTPFSNGPIDELIQTYHIKDTVGLTDVVVSEKEDYHYLVGKKNGKFWLAQYDKDTKEELYSFVDNEGKFKFTETVDLGFGMSAEYNVGLKPITVYNNNQIVAMNYKFISNNEIMYIYYLIENKKIASKFASKLKYAEVRDWYNQSILFFNGENTISNDHDARTHGAILFYKMNNEYVIYEDKSNNETKSSRFENVLPIGLFEYIYCAEIGLISRNSFNPVKNIWLTKIKNYIQDAKFEFTLMKHEDNMLKYKANVTLFDGSKDSFEFAINIDTGKIID